MKVTRQGVRDLGYSAKKKVEIPANLFECKVHESIRNDAGEIECIKCGKVRNWKGDWS
jgi:hypothetical protein